MDKTTYLTGVGAAFDQGAMDGQAQTQKKDYGGAYAAGYDGYYLPTPVRPVALDAASKGWDDGAAGAAHNVPSFPAEFSAGNLLADLNQTYGFAYDLGKANAGSGAQSTSHAGWWIMGILGAAAVVTGAGYVISSKNEHAHANPERRYPFKLALIDAGDTWTDEYGKREDHSKLVAKAKKWVAKSRFNKAILFDKDAGTQEHFEHASANPAKGKAVAEHGGYRWATTYETWSEEDLWAGDTDDRGWEYEFSKKHTYNSLADLLQDIPSHSWLEWSSSPPCPRSWITSDRDENRAYFEKGETTYYALHIEHADGTPLTQAEVNFVDSKIFGERKRRR